ncbi:NADH dehydrogenase [ubiquinone] iron-sulfur protein 6, mitochondrial isoform X2 [Chionomys nivalis]|uniref:NADH dehydrogenase [ubiquinone] iron-sulfur protein 6, mitochondrial isoform X2 n=1 Tax=Chionomys nivalis TaxID=269649 RepID=UPI00259A53AE|nr:NADH dehydrogenase [ubiquinone] iron-sulfur protein 6, mitochondrial isoform X2 [Chionomys nivalis]
MSPFGMGCLKAGACVQSALLAVIPAGIPSVQVRCLLVYDEKDYRRIRFVDRQKEVNENFAIDLIAEQPVNEVDHRIIACDGGGGALGHPKVYINLDKETKTGTCGYCGLQFKQHHH